MVRLYSPTVKQHSCLPLRTLYACNKLDGCQYRRAGAGALDKKRRKQYNEQQLAQLGLKASKAQKMAAAVGKGKSYRWPWLGRRDSKQHYVYNNIRQTIGCRWYQRGGAAGNAGLKQLHVKREHKATEAAIEAGHLSRKSVSKQQKKERETSHKAEGSLNEDNGAFVGVLPVV